MFIKTYVSVFPYIFYTKSFLFSNCLFLIFKIFFSKIIFTLFLLENIFFPQIFFSIVVRFFLIFVLFINIFVLLVLIEIFFICVYITAAVSVSMRTEVFHKWCNRFYIISCFFSYWIVRFLVPPSTPWVGDWDDHIIPL